MTNNTIANVPRELLEEVMLAAQRMPVRGPSIRAKLHALLSAPSPAGVDGLETICVTQGGCNVSWTATKVLSPAGTALCRLSDAQAIIDELRGELAVALKVPSVAAMHTYLDTECAKDNIRLGAERDQQAHRIGELEGLLRSCLPALSDGGCAALANRIAATLSAGKEEE